MILGGLQKTTLIDYPGKLACTVFTVGCNFRCPFCHNRDLVTLRNFKNKGLEELSEESFFDFLKKRKKILDGVCITGGEPTINKDLPGFIKKIKALGLSVKLDTNGSNPEMLEGLIKEGLVDFVAMDIKTTFSGYEKVVKAKSSKLKAQNSIKLILESGLPYEFRTTVVPGIHDKKIMTQLASDLKKTVRQCNNGTMKQLNFILQKFQPQNCLDEKFLKIKPFSDKEMREMLTAVRKIIPNARIRGND